MSVIELIEALGPIRLLRGDDFDAFLQTEFMNPFIIKGGQTRIDPKSGLTITTGGEIVGEKPPEQRHSYGSFNTNGPLSDQQTRAIMQGLAHISEETGKPSFGYIVNSHHHNAKEGNDYSLEGICRGVALSWIKENVWAQSYNLVIPAGFDHFTMPKFNLERDYKAAENSTMTKDEAITKIMGAIGFFEKQNLDWKGDVYSDNLAFLSGIDPESLKELRSREDIIEKFANYLTSDIYQRYRQEAKMSMKFGNFARHMFEGGALPFILNAVASRDMMATREEIRAEAEALLGEKLQTRVELSIEDTGDDSTNYTHYSPERAASFANVGVAFHKFTGGDAYSFPLGLAHARAISEGGKLELDINRLKGFLTKMYEVFGRIIPTAGHAGTSLFNWASNEELAAVYNHVKDSGLALSILHSYDERLRELGNKGIGKEYEATLKQRNVIQRFLDSKGMLGSESTNPDVWRGYLTQININTNSLVENAVGALFWILAQNKKALRKGAPKDEKYETALLTNLYEVITRSKKVDGLPSGQIKAIRDAVIHANKNALNMYGQSPYGGGIDTKKLERGYLVPGNATVGPGAE